MRWRARITRRIRIGVNDFGDRLTLAICQRISVVALFFCKTIHAGLFNF